MKMICQSDITAEVMLEMDRAAGAPEIEITSNMIEAGVDALRATDWAVDSRREIVIAILRAGFSQIDR